MTLDDTIRLSPFDGPNNETLASRVADQIKRWIVTGQLKPGQRLVEKEIAAACHVSRTPLREAFARLVNEGLAVSIAYRGIFVRRISLRHVREIYELRIGIEGLAAMLAAERHKKSDLDHLAELLVAMDAEQPGDEADELKLLNERFHRGIAAASGNSLLVQQLDDLWIWVSLARTSNWTATGRGETSRGEHHALYQAISAGDGITARALAETHVRRAWEAVEPFLRDESADVKPEAENPLTERWSPAPRP
jgi:DNA-binding GntR family transcriptional regulator